MFVVCAADTEINKHNRLLVNQMLESFLHMVRMLLPGVEPADREREAVAEKVWDEMQSYYAKNGLDKDATYCLMLVCRSISRRFCLSQRAHDRQRRRGLATAARVFPQVLTAEPPRRRADQSPFGSAAVRGGSSW